MVTGVHDVLILGMSSLVRRRVLPALLGMSSVGKVHVASRRPLDSTLIPHERLGSYWPDYLEALEECEPCVVYVSLPNDLHAPWVGAALQRGFHVVVDKPAVVGDFSRAEVLTALANRRSLVLAEATVWTSHPIAGALQEITGSSGSGPLAVVATFTSPPMEAANFRYSADHGGGALLDRGSYAVSCGRILFGADPIDVTCAVLDRMPGQDGVDLAFSTMMRYPNGVLLGMFSLASEYQNRIELIGPDVTCSVDRVFTPPADYEGVLAVRRDNREELVRVPAQDGFACFMDSVFAAIEQGDYVTHADLLRDDAHVMERLWTAAKEETG